MKQPYYKLILIGLLLANSVYAQQAPVLPNDGSFSKINSPQGGLRYQRQLFLITAAEMSASGLPASSIINSIGFNIAVAQSDTSKGNLKVYLQNTTDVTSRIDEAWTPANTTVPFYNATGLSPGQYEWQIEATCGGTSTTTSTQFFNNDNNQGCNPPYNLEAENITSGSATIKWEAITSPDFTHYLVEYKRPDQVDWTAATTNGSAYTLTGLNASKLYQYRIKTICSSGQSQVAAATFTTGYDPACAVPSAPGSTMLNNFVAKFAWHPAAGATRYDMQFRRQGTADWISTISFTNSISITLKEGTYYEWAVRTVCAAGLSEYVNGSPFFTGGIPVCHIPTAMATREITSSSAKFTWKPTPGATSYVVKYRLKNTITWTNAYTPMILVSDGLITIPDTTGEYDIPFANGNTFTYTGGGLYVAFEYTRPAGNLRSPNISLATNSKPPLAQAGGTDTRTFSLTSRSDVLAPGHAPILVASALRPETRLGSPGLSDVVEAGPVYALGFTASQFQSPTPISVRIKNKSNSSRTFPVTLKIKSTFNGMIRNSFIESVTIPGNSHTIVNFNGWTPIVNGSDSLIVSVPPEAGENVLLNNSAHYIQTVNNSIISYADSSSRLTSTGFGIESGLLLNRHHIDGCGKVNAARIYLDGSAKGHDVYAVILSSTGSILATSDIFNPDSNQVNTWRSFYFTTPQALTNTDYYIGLAQTSSATPWFPVGVQFDGNSIRTNAFYRAKLDGTQLTHQQVPGRLMIKAELTPSLPNPYITGKLSLCAGATNTLTVGSADTRFANRVISFSFENTNSDYSAHQVLGTPDVYPANVISPQTWITHQPDAAGEFIELGYADGGPVNFIDIYETSNPGSVEKVYVKNPSTNQFEEVYSAIPVPLPQAARIKRITFTTTLFNVSEIRLSLRSESIPGFNPIDAVAIGKTEEPASYNSYAWTPAGEITPSIQVNTASTLQVTVTNAAGCTATATAIVYNAMAGSVTITTRRPLIFCHGDSTWLRSSRIGGNTWSTGETTDSIRVKNSGVYTVTYNDGSGCGVTQSSPVTVTANPLPVINITGNFPICPGGTISLNAGSGFTNYIWSTGSLGQIITTSSPGPYSVTVTNNNGCKTSTNTLVLQGIAPAPVITGDISICPGASTVLDAGSGFTSYNWSTGHNSRTITVNAPGTYSVTVSNAGGCSGSDDVYVDLLTPPAPTIVGATGFCPGGSSMIRVMQLYNSYLWSNGSTVSSTLVSSVGFNTVTVTDAQGCTGSASRFMVQHIPPSPVITGTLSFCGGSSTVLQAGLGYASYLWLPSGGTSHSITATTVGTFTVTVTNTQGCSGTTAATTTINGVVPVTPGPISGATMGLCNTAGNIYTISPVTNASYYEWTLPGNATITRGQGSTSITVKFTNNFTSGNITVSAANACGISPSLNPRLLFVQGPPALPGNITGQTSGVCNTSKFYSIASVAGTNTYTWTVPAGATITNGQGTVSITVNFSASYVGGSVCVSAANNCGVTAAKCVTVQGALLTPGIINGPAMVCARTNNVVYSTTEVPGGTSYTWTVPQGWTIVSGQGSITLTVNVGTKAGNLTVKANGACASSALATLAVQAKCPTSIVLRNDHPVPDEEVEYKVLAYPNPTSGAVTLAFTDNKIPKQQLKIYDARGKLVYSKEVIIENDMVTLNLGFLAKGMYHLSIVNGKEQMTIRLIRN